MRKKIIVILVILNLCIITIISNIVRPQKTRFWQHENNKKTMKIEKAQELTTHLPIVKIDTQNQILPEDKEEITSNIKIYDKKKTNNNLSDIPQIDNEAKVKYRGRSSIHFDKKGYEIEFINKDGNDKNLEIMGMNKNSKWALHGPYLDKTLIRNYIWYNLAGEIMEYAPNCRFCEVIVNNEYKGLYLMIEVINQTNLNISKFEKDRITNSYIVRLDDGSKNEEKNIETSGILNNRFGEYTKMNIVYPSKKNLTQQTKEFIISDFNKFEECLNSEDYKNYKKYIDEQSFIDYFLINELSKNYDAGELSKYLYKDVNGKLKFCVWDFNNSCDNYQEKSMNDINWKLTQNNWYEMLLKNEQFADNIIERYKELRNTNFNEEYINKKIDETIQYLGDAIERNFEVWGYTFKLEENLLTPCERNLHSYEDAVKQMKDFISQRLKYMDENIETIKKEEN